MGDGADCVWAYCATCAREQVSDRKVLVLAWISVDGSTEIPWVLGKAMSSTELAGFDEVHLLTYTYMFFILGASSWIWTWGVLTYGVRTYVSYVRTYFVLPDRICRCRLPAKVRD